MVSMKNRYLAGALESICFPARKMALVSGPRQSGKTTLARMMIGRRRRGTYHNWDQVEFRRAWAKSPSSLVPPPGKGGTPLLVLDEIQKDRRWKRTLKGVYDTLAAPCDILVTGSARLNVYVKGGESLLGRYYHFRLHPFSLREMANPRPATPEEFLERLFSGSLAPARGAQDRLDALMAYGPFPEPLFAQDARRARLWRRNREQLVVREDLRDLSRIPDLGRIEILTALLPERVGSPFSVAAMREDLETGFETVKRWLGNLEDLYYLFQVPPWSRRVPRSLRRSRKVYLWDWGAIPNEAARFENLVAGHFLKACHYWTDTGEGEFDLYYLRDKEGHEIDFLIVRDRVPWLPVEVKLRDTDPSPSWKRFAPLLPVKRGLQVVRAPVRALHRFGDAEVLVAGAAGVLDELI